jgi:3-oxoacyl-[acyl-carrier-protein] synthase III
MMRSAKITGIGSYLPSRVVTNAEMEKIVDTTDEWIITRTGIRERHYAAPNETTSSMAIKASKKALEVAGIDPIDLDLILVGTVTPDVSFPSVGCLVQDALGSKKAAAFDVSAGCTGFIYGTHIAKAYIDSGLYKKILVIGTEKLTAVTNWKDRNTCVLFGDGAGAIILEAQEEEEGLISSVIASDGSLGYLLERPAGGVAMPITRENVDGELMHIRMKGNEVFKYAVTYMGDVALEALRLSPYTCEDVNWLIPHQANIRIIDAVRRRLRLPAEKVFTNIDHTGNTSAASVPVALDELYRNGNLKRGDLVELVAFGAGFTWGATLLRWTKE